MTRRDFLKAGSMAGLSIGGVPIVLARNSSPSLAGFQGATGIRKFSDPLPVPNVVDVRSGGSYSFHIRPAEQFLGARTPTGDAILTKVWGYEGTYPGPTLLGRRGVPISVQWHNDLVDANGEPVPHLLPIDTSIHWADPFGDDSTDRGIPVCTHVHGAASGSESDGLPDAWFTPGYTSTGRLFNPVCHYPNEQEAATIWYHDHALGITRLNVYAGLAGFYVLLDDNQDALAAANAIPVAPYDLGLAIQDKMLDSEGQLYYPSEPEEEGAPDPSIVAEFFGDMMLVNGMAWPYLDVEPRPYRLRLLNGCDSRFLDLFLSHPAPFAQIATDLGMLDAPVAMTRLLMGPGERAELVVDFSGMEGQTIVLKNRAKTPYPMGSSVDPRTTGEVMAFNVSKPLDPSIPIPTLPSNLRPVLGPVGMPGPSVRTRKLLLYEGEDGFGRLLPLLGTVEGGAMMWHDPLTEEPHVGDVETWEIYNTTMDAHPIHLHLVGFRILSRQKFRADQEETGALSNIRFIGRNRPPEPNENGWKDTAIMYPGEVTRIIAKFDREGEYVWHCHILSHEDHEMMRPYRVLP